MICESQFVRDLQQAEHPGEPSERVLLVVFYDQKTLHDLQRAEAFRSGYSGGIPGRPIG